MGPRAGLDRRKVSSPLGFNPGPSSPLSVAIPTELPGPQPIHNLFNLIHIIKFTVHFDTCKEFGITF